MVHTFTSKVQRSPLSVHTLAVSATTSLDVSDVTHVLDPVARSKALHCDVSVSKVGVSDAHWDPAPYCRSDRKASFHQKREREKNNKSKCRKRSSHSLAGAWVGTYVGRHRGGRGRHWPSGPQVICWAPSSWKPSTQVKFTLSPTRTVSPEGLRELATTGLEQVVSPAGPSKTDSSFLPSSLNKHSPPLCF